MARTYKPRFIRPPSIPPAPMVPWEKMLRYCLNAGVPKSEIYKFTGMSKELTERMLGFGGVPYYGQGLRIMQLYSWCVNYVQSQKGAEQ